MQRKIRIGVVGLGRMGTIYAQQVAFAIPEAELTAIATRRTSVLQDYAEKLAVPYTFTDPYKLLQHDILDAVIIATPTHTHKDFIIATAQAGKHVFCEKPIALTLEATDAALHAVDEAGVRLCVGFMRRCDAAYVAAKQKIAQGVIGTPVLYKGTGRDPERPPIEYACPEVSGGLLLDLGIHDFDLARWLMGSDIKRVYCEGGVLVYPELEAVGDIDNAVINIVFENGTIGTIDVSRNARYGYDVHTEILGSEGGLHIGYLRQTPLNVLTPKHGVCHDIVQSFPERFHQAYVDQIERFIHCLYEDTPFPADGYDARKALEVGIAAIRSYKEKMPVEIR